MRLMPVQNVREDVFWEWPVIQSELPSSSLMGFPRRPLLFSFLTTCWSTFHLRGERPPLQDHPEHVMLMLLSQVPSLKKRNMHFQHGCLLRCANHRLLQKQALPTELHRTRGFIAGYSDYTVSLWLDFHTKSQMNRKTKGPLNLYLLRLWMRRKWQEVSLCRRQKAVIAQRVIYPWSSNILNLNTQCSYPGNVQYELQILLLYIHTLQIYRETFSHHI